MQRGEVWWGVWPNDPEKKKRPLLIVSNNFRNSNSKLHDVVVVKLTSLHREDGTQKITNPSEDVVHTFKKPTVIKCGSLFTVEKTSLVQKHTQVPIQVMNQIDACLKTVLDLH